MSRYIHIWWKDSRYRSSSERGEHWANICLRAASKETPCVSREHGRYDDILPCHQYASLGLWVTLIRKKDPEKWKSMICIVRMRYKRDYLQGQRSQLSLTPYYVNVRDLCGELYSDVMMMPHDQHLVTCAAILKSAATMKDYVELRNSCLPAS